MYGELLKPNRAGFFFEPSAWSGKESNKEFSIFIKDLDDKSNDGVRDLDHPDFDKFWGNDCENTFSPLAEDEIEDEKLKALSTKAKARKWLLSIGLIEL